MLVDIPAHERAACRDLVDALRLMLGMDPLYGPLPQTPGLPRRMTDVADLRLLNSRPVRW